MTLDGELLLIVDRVGRVADEEAEPLAVLLPDGRLAGTDARSLGHLGWSNAAPPGSEQAWLRVAPDGRVTFERGSRSGAETFHREQPEGLIDPLLKTISFWDGDQPVLALHAYATHPMSYYGQGEVSSDFVGLARDRPDGSHVPGHGRRLEEHETGAAGTDHISLR